MTAPSAWRAMWPVSSVSLRPAHISSTRWTSNISVVQLCWPNRRHVQDGGTLRNASGASGDPAMNGRSGRFFGPRAPYPRLGYGSETDTPSFPDTRTTRRHLDQELRHRTIGSGHRPPRFASGGTGPP